MGLHPEKSKRKRLRLFLVGPVWSIPSAERLAQALPGADGTEVCAEDCDNDGASVSTSACPVLAPENLHVRWDRDRTDLEQE